MSRNGLITKFHSHEKDAFARKEEQSKQEFHTVMYANGKLWGALDTALNPGGGGQRAALAWYILNPVVGKVVLQGYLGAAGYDFT